MQNPALFHVLLDHLEAIDTPTPDVDRFVDDRPLVSLVRRDKFEPVKCSSCGTRFDVPIDD